MPNWHNTPLIITNVVPSDGFAETVIARPLRLTKHQALKAYGALKEQF